ncbi:MAG: hypothetical protein ACOH10_13710 [Rhodoglobus sp.]
MSSITAFATDAQRTYLTAQLDAMPTGSIVTSGRTMEWTKSHADTWTSGHDGVSTSADVAGAGPLLTYPDAWGIPSWPAPADLEAPAWASTSSGWEWFDDAWQHSDSREFGDLEGVDIVVDQTVRASIDGTTEIERVGMSIDVLDVIESPAVASRISAWVVEAAAVFGSIPAQRTA